MKKYKLLYIILPLLFCSCGDWLEVNPSDQTDEDKLFASGNGYRTALNGIYKEMSSQTLWGQDLSWGLMDVLAQYYPKSELGANSYKYNRGVQYLYEDKDLAPVLQNIWSTGYNVIANCNNVLKNIVQEDTVKFAEKRLERDMIHGEVLACRAFMHFELLRLYAPSVKQDDQKKYIPYYESFPLTSASYLSVSEVIGKVKADLLEAKRILATVDTLESMRYLFEIQHRMEGGSGTGMGTDVFFASRGFRLNYTAVTALLAIVYSYNGELEKAFDEATEVINFKDETGKLCFGFTGKSTFGANPKRYEELIFALSNTKLTEYFKKCNDRDDGDCVLGIDYFDWEEIKDENSADMRWTEDGGIMIPYGIEDLMVMSKYQDLSGMSALTKRIIPVIRLSEMYYIRGEYYAEQNDWTNALYELETVSMDRGCSPNKFTIQSVEDYQHAVLSDAYKEFIGEGQLWYFYKKYDIAPESRYVARFVFPLPDNELVY